MLHAVFLFNKCGGGSRLDDLALPAVQIEHRHIDSRIMDLLPAHHKRCIDHLDRGLLRETRVQQLFQQLDHHRALPARLLPGAHPVREDHTPPAARHLHHRKIIPRDLAASLADPGGAGHGIICRAFPADDCHVPLPDHLSAVTLGNESPPRRFGHPFDEILHWHFLLLHRTCSYVYLIFSFSVHKKMGIQYPDPLLFQMRHDPFFQPLVRKDAVLQLLCSAFDHIRKRIHLDRAPFPAPGDPVCPYHILPRLVEPLQHFTQKPGRHDTPLHEFPLCLCIEFISVMVYRREHFIPHLISMYKVFSPAPGTFFTLFAYLLFHPVKHAVDLIRGKRLLPVFQPEECLRQLLEGGREFFYLFHIRAVMQRLSFIHGHPYSLRCS